MQILGLTYQNIRSLIVGKVGDGGEEAMSVAEKTVEIVQKVSTEGPQALWEEAKDKLASMRDTVISGIIGWVRNTIIVQAVSRLLGMFTPVGAIIEAGRGIYNTIMFFVQKANEIASLANAIFESITNIAQRRLGPAASYIESTLGKGLTLSIGFLAKYIGLSGIPEKIKEIIGKVRKPVDKAVGKVTDWIAGKVKLIVAKVKGGWDKFKDRFRKKDDTESDREEETLKAGLTPIRTNFRMGEEDHTVLLQLQDGSPEVLMASGRYRPLNKKIKKFQSMLENDEHFKTKFGNKGHELSKIEDSVDKLKSEFREAGKKKDESERASRYQTLEKRLKVIADHLQKFGDETGLSDVPKDEARNIDRLTPKKEYLASKKHGLYWTEGRAEAMKVGPDGKKTPQGQRGSVKDLEFAGEQAATLRPREGSFFDLPDDHSSYVWRTDGTKVAANRIWVRNNGNGSFHGYPLE